MRAIWVLVTSFRCSASEENQLFLFWKMISVSPSMAVLWSTAACFAFFCGIAGSVVPCVACIFSVLCSPISIREDDVSPPIHGEWYCYSPLHNLRVVLDNGFEGSRLQHSAVLSLSSSMRTHVLHTTRGGMCFAIRSDSPPTCDAHARSLCINRQ